LLGAFDERKDVAHAENARNDSLRVKAFESVVFFPQADEFYGRAADFADGKRRAAACVAVKFGEDDAGEPEALVKCTGGANSVLTDHGVSDEENLARLQFLLEMAELIHQVVVNMKAAGSVDQAGCAAGEFRFPDGSTNDFERLVGSRAGPEICADGFGDLRELFARRGTIDVGRDDNGAVAMLRQPFCKLAGGGGLTGTLQADNHPDRRRAGGEKRLGMFAEQSSELVTNDLNDLLIGRKLQHDFAAERLAASAGEQFVHDTDRDVAFEHGFADFGERGVQVLFGELALPAEILESALQLFGEVFKHKDSFQSSVLRSEPGDVGSVGQRQFILGSRGGAVKRMAS